MEDSKPVKVKMKILLIEDNPGDSFYIKEIMQVEDGFRFELDITPRLDEGIKLAHSKHYDIVLLDLLLPDSRGIDSFHKFNIIHPKIPVVIISGLDDSDLALQAVSEGAQDYIVKQDLKFDNLNKKLQFAYNRNKHIKKIEEVISDGVINIEENVELNEKQTEAMDALKDITQKLLAVSLKEERVHDSDIT